MKLSYLYAKFVRKFLIGKAVAKSNIHKTSVVGTGSNVVGTTMGKYSYCGNDCQIVNADIGAFCSISDHVFIGGAEHPKDWVSTSPVFQNVSHSGPKKRFAKFDLPQTKKTIIGNDVWIGHGVTIKQGVRIGDGAVIGSGALVTKDVPSYAIVGGVPAKTIKYRFDEDTISALMQSQWWMLSDDELEQNSYLIREPELFVKQAVSLKETANIR